MSSTKQDISEIHEIAFVTVIIQDEVQPFEDEARLHFI
jgi:hypothetical protein